MRKCLTFFGIATSLLVLSSCQPKATASFEKIFLEDGPMLITDFAFIPETKDVLVTDQMGTVSHYRLTGMTGALLGRFTVPNVHMQRDCGLLSITLDPDFATNHFFFVTHCVSIQASQVTRLTFDSKNYDAIEASAKKIITVGSSRAVNPYHNAGAIGFDKSGALYAFFGDKTILFSAQNPDTLLGKMLRIIPSRTPEGSGYTIPTDNPFVGNPIILPEIYATGFREPWRGSLDSQGRYWIGDVGGVLYEEVNLISKPGMDFGWQKAEGPCKKNCDGFTDPAISWDRAMDHPFMKEDSAAAKTISRLVWVGPEYRGTIYFGDFCAGWIRRAQADSEGRIIKNEFVGHLESVTAMKEGSDGFLYVSSYPPSIADISGICLKSDEKYQTPDQVRDFNYTLEGSSTLWRMVLR